MVKKKVFIDGSAGTTGLRINERLAAREDIELISLPEEKRKDDAARRSAICESDFTFLCLPDDAARQAVALAEGSGATVIDASTAHRTLPDWAYGLPELGESFYNKIAYSRRIAVPGCHASGFIALVYPLIEAGLLPDTALLTCHSLTGYSGGGKKMIAQYEQDSDPLLKAPRQYGITQQHKHLKEMQAITGIKNTPVFCPIVADFYSGMEVTVPLFAQQIKGSIQDIKNIYAEKYADGIVRYAEAADEQGFMSAAALSGRDDMRISVAGNDERMLLIARYDNLGKGASGAAIECMNISMGIDPKTGLNV